MKTENKNPDDTRLAAFLRSSRNAPPLPPQFQQNVWRRIEEGEAVAATGSLAWLDSWVAWILRPGVAIATAALLLVAGAVVGAHDGGQLAKRDAQARYVATVAPESLH